MNKVLAVTIFVVLSVGVWLWSQSAGLKSLISSPDQKLKVAVTIYPLYDIVRNIAGKEIETVLILPPGSSPHTFSPAPTDIKKIANSQAVFTIGHNCDDWVVKLTESVNVDEVVVVDKYIALLEEQNTVNPHYWLSIPNGILIARQVKDELTSIFPKYTFVFEQNYLEYIKELRVVDQNLRDEFNNISVREIATFHNAWTYFAQEYGLEIATTFEEFPGKAPTPEYLRQFQEKIKQHNIKVIFTEPQFSTVSLEPIAADLGVTLSILDPLGGVENRLTFIQLMQFNISRITKALN